MRRAPRFLLEIFAMTFVATAGQAAPADQARKAVLDAARKPVEKSVQRKIWFKEKSYRQLGEWAFLLAEMQDAHGRPIDYHGTPKARQAEAGFLSKDYAALLKREDGLWTVVADAIGPTDVVWEGWSAQYGAPAVLFEG